MNGITAPGKWFAGGEHRRSGHGKRGRKTLPLRLWLILAVAAIISAGFLAQVGLTAVMSTWHQQAEHEQLAAIRRILGTSTSAWQTGAWQHRAASSLGAMGVDVAIYAPPPGAASTMLSGWPVYVTTGARGYLAASAYGNVPPDSVFERMVIHPSLASTSAGDSEGTGEIGVALIWLTQTPPGELPQALWPLVELGTFAFTLAIVVWLVGLPVLRPLSELSQAAGDMAGGDLDVNLVTESPVHEIAAVSSALVGTGAALRESLARQTALEEDRRLFIAAVAHDLRTPLFMLRGYLKGLERGVAATPEKVGHYVATCMTQADALDRRIADLFAFARLEYLDQKPERVPLEMGALLRETVEAARPAALTRGISLVVEDPHRSCLVRGDRHLLVRAVENLLDNALRHTPEGGQVVVRCFRCAVGVGFAIEDTGPGIAADELPRLFTPMYRGDESRNRHFGGAGLGLTIARRILRVHGGDLTVANAPAGGAVFTGKLCGDEEDGSLANGAGQEYPEGNAAWVNPREGEARRNAGSPPTQVDAG